MHNSNLEFTLWHVVLAISFPGFKNGLHQFTEVLGTDVCYSWWQHGCLWRLRDQWSSLCSWLATVGTESWTKWPSRALFMFLFMFLCSEYFVLFLCKVHFVLNCSQFAESSFPIFLFYFQQTLLRAKPEETLTVAHHLKTSVQFTEAVHFLLGNIKCWICKAPEGSSLIMS